MLIIIVIWENIEGFDARVVTKTFDALDILSHTSSTPRPTMVGPGEKFLNLRSVNA